MKLDFLNNLMQKPIDSKSNSIIGNFINELKDNLNKRQSFECSKNLPWHTLLNFAKFDGNFALCFDNNTKTSYYIPKENIMGTLPEPGEILKINSPGKFYVDYTAIPVKENLIDDILNNCKIAK